MILGLVYAMINALGSQLGAVRFRVPVRVAMTQTKRPAHAGEVNADSIRLPREVRTMSAWCRHRPDQDVSRADSKLAWSSRSIALGMRYPASHDE